MLVDTLRHEPAVVAVRRLLQDPALAREMGAAGRRAVETHYNWDRVAADVIRIGHEVAARDAPFLLAAPRR
jgi:glycosyltransferase involved in cell wall biosynthesis